MCYLLSDYLGHHKTKQGDVFKEKLNADDNKITVTFIVQHKNVDKIQEKKTKVLHEEQNNFKC